MRTTSCVGSLTLILVITRRVPIDSFEFPRCVDVRIHYIEIRCRVDSHIYVRLSHSVLYGMESLSQMGLSLYNAFNKVDTPATSTKQPHLTPLERLQQRSSPRRQVKRSFVLFI